MTTKAFIVYDPKGAEYKDGTPFPINHRLIYENGKWHGTHNLARIFTSEGMFEKFLGEMLRADTGTWGMLRWERDEQS